MTSQTGNLKRKDAATHPGDSAQPFLSKLEEIVLKNINNEQFGVEDLAREMNLSRFQIYRKLNMITGKSICRFIRETRLMRAMSLLRQGTETASGIAYGVGFGSATYFNKCFHEFFNKTPGQVLKRHGFQAIDVTKEKQWQGKTGQQAIREVIAISPNSIAILPFVNMSNDPVQEYFCDGISEEIINTLSQYPHLKVVGRTSSFNFKGKNIDIRHIGKVLGVSKIMEGSVRKSGSRIRIAVRLIESSSGYQLWSKKYDRILDDFIDIQDEIALEIGYELNLSLSSIYYNNKIISKH